MALRFRIGSIPVQVHFFFFLTALLLGMGGREPSPASAGIWIGVVFVSVLLHELGHALAGKLYGLAPAIQLHGMGGTTSWIESRGKRLGHGAQMFISFAGPLVGLVVGGITWAIVALRGGPTTELGEQFVNSVLFVNLLWSFFNLLPILPLDGGNLMAHGLLWVTKGKARRAPHYISIAIAALVGAGALYVRWVWVLVLAALYVYQNVRALSATKVVEEETPRMDELDEGFAALEAGDGHKAIRIAERLLGTTRVLEVRLGALRLLAQGRLLEGQWGPLMQLLEVARFEMGPAELSRFEQAAVELERPDEAAQIRSWLEGFAARSEPAPFRA